jgi:hypothetical protein
MSPPATVMIIVAMTQSEIAALTRENFGSITNGSSGRESSTGHAPMIAGFATESFLAELVPTPHARRC